MIKLAESKGSELNPHILTHHYLLSDYGNLFRFDWKIKSILSENIPTEDIPSSTESKRLFGVYFGITSWNIDFLDDKEFNKIVSALTSLAKETAESSIATLV